MVISRRTERRMDRQLKRIFTDLRNDPEFVWLETKEAAEHGWQAIALRIGVRTAVQQDPSPVNRQTWRVYAQYFFSSLTNGFLLPAAAGLAVVLFIIGGWVSAVAASADALPGDRLYGFKIATERLQVTLTVDLEKKTDLRLAFAGRRLAELTALRTTELAIDNSRILTAVNGFKEQVNGATTTLQELAGSNGRAVSVAKAVDTAADGFKEQLKAQDAVAEVVEADVEAASVAAVEVIMSSAEGSGEDSAAAQEARNTFEEKQKILDGKIKTLIGRIAVLNKIGISSELSVMTEKLLVLSDSLDQSDDLLASGAFRTAFAFLDGQEEEFERIEAEVAVLESPATTEEENEPDDENAAQNELTE